MVNATVVTDIVSGARAGPPAVPDGRAITSTHIVQTQTTVSVLGNSAEGAWPVIGTLAEAIDAELA